MNAQIIGVVLVTAAVCAVIALIALLCQAGNHSEDRAALLREHLDTLRALHVPEQEQEDDPEWWDRQFDGITSELGSDGGDAP